MIDNKVISGLTGCEAYIYDLVLHSNSWDSLAHVQRALFDRLRAARLTVNLAKNEFCQATYRTVSRLCRWSDYTSYSKDGCHTELSCAKR